MKRRLVAAIACRNQGSRLYGKPVQNLDVESGTRVIDNIISCLQEIKCIDEIILGVSKGAENEVFIRIADEKSLRYVVGDEVDVLSRLVACGILSNATDIFRVTSESPFPFYEPVEESWETHRAMMADATFMDHVVDGCGFEILSLQALQESHAKGDEQHRSELCTLYIRENPDVFRIHRLDAPTELIRKDLRLTVDNPEDLTVCRRVYAHFKDQAPMISIAKIVHFLDANPNLIELTYPYTEVGYSTMYR